MPRSCVARFILVFIRLMSYGPQTSKNKNAPKWGIGLQRGRDSNPRYAFGVYTLSRRAPSTARTPLQCRHKGIPFFRCNKTSIVAEK